MANKMDHPGVYVPPPLFYIATFVAAILLQKYCPFHRDFFHTAPSRIVGVLMILIGLSVIISALYRFVKTKNTLITIKSATTLQTTGIYAVTRNPMYIGLFLCYIGLSFIIGSWWNFILVPLLMVVVQEYIIKREERYLERRFGQEFLDYKSRVRRWI